MLESYQLFQDNDKSQQTCCLLQSFAQFKNVSLAVLIFRLATHRQNHANVCCEMT